MAIKNVIYQVDNGVDFDEIHFKTKAAQVVIEDTGNNFTSPTVEGAMAELFQNVSNGKSSIATAITDKGVIASGSDTFTSLATKISSISISKLPKWYIPSNFWGLGKDLTTTRQLPGIGAVGSNIYLIGGKVSGITDVNECYNTLDNTWTTKSPMPTKRDGLTCATVGSKIYAIGGAWYSDSYTYVYGTNECYDTLSNTWATKTVMPATRAYMASAVVGDNIYVMGGGGSNYSINNHECYNTVTNTWSTKTASRKTRFQTASAVGDNIYMIGGFDDGFVSQSIDCYNTITNTWTFNKAYMTGRHGLTSVVMGDSIYIMGGSSQYNVVQAYNVVTNTVTNKPNMTIGRTQNCSQVVDEVIYNMGGNNAGGYLLENSFGVL